MKVYDAASLRNVALVGHSGSGKTQLAAALLFDAGAVNRSAKSTTGRRSPITTKKRSLASTPCPPASPTPSGTRPRSISSTRRAGELPQRRARGAARRRRGAGRGRRAARGRSVDRESVGDGRRAVAAAARRPEPARPRARQPRAVAGIAARRVRAHRHPDPAADRRGEGLRRRDRPGGDEGVHVRERRQRQAGRRRDPRQHDRDAPTRRARRSSRWSPRRTTR